MSHEKFKSCIETCYNCAIACDHCASEDLNEADVKLLAECIRLDRECPAFCRAAAHIMSMGGQFAKEICAICAKVCDACAAECEKHQHMDHCKECAQKCRHCSEECRKMAA